MLKDHNHDLIKQLSEDSSSLWRYDSYIKSAQGRSDSEESSDSMSCEHCINLWKKLKQTDEERVELLKEEIKRHVNEGRFD